MKRWPFWSFKGFYKGPHLHPFDRSYFYWTCNEGEFPNFMIGIKRFRLFQFYCAIAPGFRACYTREGGWRFGRAVHGHA